MTKTELEHLLRRAGKIARERDFYVFGSQAVLRLVLAVLLGTLASCFTAVASTGSSRDKPPIPKDLFFEFIPIPAEENAIIEWRKAHDLFQPSSQQEGKAMAYAWNPNAKKPSDEDRAKLRAWLRRNEEALRVFEGSLKKPKAQWPGLGKMDEVEPAMVPFVVLSRARLLEADDLAEQGEFEKAAALLNGNIQLAAKAIQADGSLLQYILAGRARTMTEGAILRLAAHESLPLPIMDKLLKMLPVLSEETNIYAHHVKVEFSMYAYPAMDVNRIAEIWTKGKAADIAVTMLYPEEFRRPFKVLIDPSLVAKHPLPLDQLAEIERLAEQYRSFLTNSVSSWSDRNDDIEIETQKDETNLLQEIQPLMKAVENEKLPLNHQAAERVLPLYLAITNPVGRIFECSYSRFMEGDLKVFEFRTEREAARAVLGCLIYERRKGHLPASLDDLVDQKILDAVPTDYFADDSMHYSRERRLIWSVSFNGENNDGDGDPDHRWTGKDTVWRIPELKK